LQVTGVPVVKSETDRTLVGVLSKKDLSKSGKFVRDVYSSPPVAARPDNKVADAACLMLKHKVGKGIPNAFLPNTQILITVFVLSRAPNNDVKD
jgi:CBS domain-containing protein